MRKFTSLIGATVLCLGMIGSGQAAMIEGQLDFVGFAAVDRENGQFVSIDYLFAPMVVSATGDYASTVNFGDSVNVIDPINFSTMTLPETIWSVGGFSFSLEQISINDATTVGGSGLIMATGFDDTEGFWSLTSQGKADGMFSFSATAVPEPSTIALFSVGLLGLGLTRRKSKLVEVT